MPPNYGVYTKKPWQSIKKSRIFVTMKVANIVSENKIELEPASSFNFVSSMDDIDESLPTLIIGWKFMTQFFPEQDILEKQIDEKTIWTYSRSEKRVDFEIDTEKFINFAHKYLISKVLYVFVDPIQYKLGNIKKILGKIKNSKKIISYHHGDMVYIYTENIVFGIDLSLLQFMGLDRSKILRRIQEDSTVFLTEANILIEYKDYVERLGNQVKYVPYLYSIRNDE